MNHSGFSTDCLQVIQTKEARNCTHVFGCVRRVTRSLGWSFVIDVCAEWHNWSQCRLRKHCGSFWMAIVVSWTLLEPPHERPEKDSKDNWYHVDQGRIFRWVSKVGLTAATNCLPWAVYYCWRRAKWNIWGLIDCSPEEEHWAPKTPRVLKQLKNKALECYSWVHLDCVV